MNDNCTFTPYSSGRLRETKKAKSRNSVGCVQTGTRTRWGIRSTITSAHDPSFLDYWLCSTRTPDSLAVYLPGVPHTSHLEVHLIAVLVVGFVPHPHELVSNPEARQEQRVYGKVSSEPHHKPRRTVETTIPQLVCTRLCAAISYRTLASELRSIVVWCKICNAFSLVR